MIAAPSFYVVHDFWGFTHTFKGALRSREKENGGGRRDVLILSYISGKMGILFCRKHEACILYIYSIIYYIYKAVLC